MRLFAVHDDQVGEIIQIEAALHVLQSALQGAYRLAFRIVVGRDRQRLCGLGPGLGKGVLLPAGALLALAVLRILAALCTLSALCILAVLRIWPALCALREHVRRQRFGAHGEVERLLRRDDADGAPSFEPAVVGQLGGENGRKRHQNERDDQRHSALPPTAVAPCAHPATSISRRTRPQSLNSMVTSTATGRVHSASGDDKAGGGHWFCQV